jgi:hypothetical protein
MFKKVNYKLIISHAFAGFFLIWAIREFVYIYDSELLRIYDHIDIIDAWRLDNKAERLAKFIAYKITASYTGIILSFIISLIITFRKKLGAINPIIVFTITVILLKVDLLTNDHVENVVYFPGEIIYGFSVQSVTFNGILLTLISLIIYTWEDLKNLFRQNNKEPENQDTET